MLQAGDLDVSASSCRWMPRGCALTITIIIHQRNAAILSSIVPVVGTPMRAAVYVADHNPAIPRGVLLPHLIHLCMRALTAHLPGLVASLIITAWR